MNRYDIYAVAGDHQWTIARGRDGNPIEIPVPQRGPEVTP